MEMYSGIAVEMQNTNYTWFAATKAKNKKKPIAACLQLISN